MRKLSNTFLMSLAAAAALLAACSSSKGTSDGGSTGAGGSGAGGIPLTPTNTGFVQDSTSGIIGAWYAYGDSAGPAANTTSTDFADSKCAMGGFTATQCSQIVAPIPGQPFMPTDLTMGEMCTNGTAAKVLPPPSNPSGSPDYSDLFGAGIGLDFNNPGGDAGVMKMPIDLSAYKGFSFDFSGTMIPIGNKIRVNFPFMGENNGTDSPYFAANSTDDHSTLSTTSTNVVHWSNIQGPAYLLSQTPAVTPPPFDPTKILSIQFQVFTNTGASIPYNFCVSNLTLLTQ
jgi:hypothetical protein